MREEDYYPAGAYDDPRAPYNEIEIPEKDFEVTISQELYKEGVCVTTDDYLLEYCHEDGHTYTDTSETDWKSAYNEEHYTALELIDKLMHICNEELSFGKLVTDFDLVKLLDECKGWKENEIDIGQA